MRPHALFARFTALAAWLMALAALLPPAASAQTTIHVPADQQTIQGAIDASGNGDTVLVAPGTYTENIDFHGHNITVTSSSGAATTILDGSQRGPTVTFQTGETRSTVLSGFTIRNGTIGPSTSTGSGGVYVHDSSPTIQNNTFTDNYCNAISVQGSPAITGNSITRTHALNAGMQCEYSGTPILLYDSYHSPFAVVSGNTITANTEWQTGIILLWESDYSAVSNNYIHDNVATAGGAGCAAICMENTSAATISGNDVERNTGGAEAGGLYALIPSDDTLTYGPAELRVLNNSFVNNGSSPQVDVEGKLSRTLLSNNLVSNNSGAAGVACFPSNGQAPVVEFNDSFTPGSPYSSGCPAAKNITVDPQLSADAAGHSVPQAAAVIDAGNDSVLPQPPTDVAGNARAQSNSAPVHIGLGALEHAGSVTQPQARLVIAPSQYQVTSGQTINVTAALVNTGTASTTPANLTLYLDGAAVQTAGIVSGTSITIASVTVASGVHTMYAATDATAALAAARSSTIVIDGGSGLGTGSGQSVVMDITPLVNVGSRISAQVDCNLSAADTSAGTMRIYDNGNLLGATAINGTSVANQTFFVDLGPHVYQCDYEGSFTGSTVGAQVVDTVAPASSFYSLPDPTDYGQAVIIGGSISPYDPSQMGTIRITEGSTVILDAPLDSTGSANTTTTTLTPGVHSFVGTITTAVSTTSASFTQTVHYAPTQMTLSASPTVGSTLTPVVLTIATTSTYKGQPVTGTVTLYDGTTALPVAGVANGTMTLPAGLLPAGNNILTAVYAGSTIFAPATSNAVTVTLTAPPPPDFSITPAKPTLTVQTEHHATVSLTLTSINNFNGPVSLSCSNLPAVASCGFSAAQYQLSSTTPVSFVLETDAILNYKSQIDGGPLSAMRMIRYAFALPLFGLLFVRRGSAWRRLCLLVAGAALLTGLSACSGKYPAHTPPGSYTVTITATGTSGGTRVIHSVPLALTVTPD